jgi:hypothetical protein
MKGAATAALRAATGDHPVSMVRWLLFLAAAAREAPHAPLVVCTNSEGSAIQGRSFVLAGRDPQPLAEQVEQGLCFVLYVFDGLVGPGA